MVAFRSLLSLGALSTLVAAHLNIILSNDDGFGSANIRALYYELKRQNHKVLMVAPAENQSGVGGTAVYPSSNLTGSGLYGLLTPGALWTGKQPNMTDEGIRYFNGTPVACVLYALDHVAPKFFAEDKGRVDLVVSGPNEGSNLGGFVFTLSGTLGAAYAAVGRGIPAVAFSAGNSTHRSYKTWNASNPLDTANVHATLAADFVSALAFGVDVSKNETVLPVGAGINVNFPKVNATCSGLPLVLTRFGNRIANTDSVIINAAGFPDWADLPGGPGINACINGDCSLPEETYIAKQTCSSSVTVFTTDYDSPAPYAQKTREHLEYTVLGKSNIAPGSYKRSYSPRKLL